MRKLISAGILLLSFGANADFVVKDFNAVDDGLIIKDTTSNLEWLKLDYTKSKKAIDVPVNIWKRGLETDHEYYTESLGNDLLGWRIANKIELQSLYASVYKNNETGHEARQTEFFIKFGTDMNDQTITQYCKATNQNPLIPSPDTCHFMKYADVGNFLLTDTFDGMWDNYNSRTQFGPVWVVRGVQTSGIDNCPAIGSDMSRIQAIEYIQHLSTQLTDPNTTVITPLNY